MKNFLVGCFCSLFLLSCFNRSIRVYILQLAEPQLGLFMSGRFSSLLRDFSVLLGPHQYIVCNFSFLQFRKELFFSARAHTFEGRKKTSSFLRIEELGCLLSHLAISFHLNHSAWRDSFDIFPRKKRTIFKFFDTNCCHFNTSPPFYRAVMTNLLSVSDISDCNCCQ